MAKNILVKKIILLLSVFIMLPIGSYPLDVVSIKPPQQQEVVVDAKQLDKRAQILQEYLAKYDSPLQNHAQDFVDAADQNHIDWKLLPSIAGVESTFGKQIPGGYNAYGWGVYGDQALAFKSWTDGIFEVSRGIKEGYVDKGLTNPQDMNRVYAASPTWGFKVSYFLKDLDLFSKKYDDKKPTKVQSILRKTAAASAQLAFNIN